MFKRIVVRVLLFGIPFTAAYMFNRPAPEGKKTPIVCAYPGDRPGELRITLQQETCKDRTALEGQADPNRARIIPAMRSLPETSKNDVYGNEPLNLAF